MNKYILPNILALLVTAATSPAFALVIDDGVVLPPANHVVNPSQPVAGISQAVLAEQWWQWALSTPAATNPLLDTTGAAAHINNDGPVFFLAGDQVGSGSVRNFTVPVGKPVFFPLINFVDLEVPTEGVDVNSAFSFIQGVGGATNLHATLDGLDLLTFSSFRQTSTAFFTVNLPASLRDAFHFEDKYVGALDAVADGYWVALDGLSAGPHTLVFGGFIPEFVNGPGAAPVTVTAQSTAIITAVPVPQTFALFLSGLGLVGIAARRRSKLAVDSLAG